MSTAALTATTATQAKPAARDAAAEKKRQRRRTLLGVAHKGALQLGMDEDARRAAQEAFSGHQSLRDFSDQQLIAWCWELKRRGADIGIPAPPPRGGSGWQRPTAAQAATIEHLCAALNLSEGALQAFVQRTTGVADARFMTKRMASEVITGLTRWARSRGADTRSRTRSAIDQLIHGDDA